MLCACRHAFRGVWRGGLRPPPAPAAATFNKELAPFFWKHCGGCHRPDGSAPFSLLTYDDVRSHARLISNVLKDRHDAAMAAGAGHGDFAGERRVTAQEIERFERWVADGATRGGGEDLPPLPAWPETGSLASPIWSSTCPSLRAFRQRPRRLSQFRHPDPVADDAIRARRRCPPGQPYGGPSRDNPDSTRAANHGVSTKQIRSRDTRACCPRPSHNPESHALGWTPGKSATFEPEGVAWRLEPGSDLVLEMHMIPTGKPEAVRPRVGLYFTDAPPTRVSLDFKLGSKTIDIPAGADRLHDRDWYTLPADVDAAEHLSARALSGERHESVRDAARTAL